MTNITENSVWENGIYQLETTDPTQGGAPAFNAGVPVDGQANAQAQQLANRTKYLKNQHEVFVSDLANEADPTKGSALVGFLQSGTGAVSRTAQDKMREVVSVKDFGAKGDGVTDDTGSFRFAAQAANGNDINPPTFSAMPNPEFVEIFVPVGNYIITSQVNAYGKDIVWRLQAGTVITGIDYLTGRVVQENVRISGKHKGILDHAVSFAVEANSTSGFAKPASILGVTDPSQLSSYTDRDSVAFYAENDGPAPTITITNADYTANSIIPSTPVDASQLSIGMIIDTMHSPNKFSGVVTSWADDGTSITVTDWYECTGSSSPASIPPSGYGAYVNPFTKIWALNANIRLRSTSHAAAGTGLELGITNEKQQLSDPSDSKNTLWGYDVVNFGPYNGSVGVIQRGPFLRGFESRGAVFDGFTVSAQGSAFPVTAFSVRCNSYEQIACRPSGTDPTQTTSPVFRVINTGDTEIGASNVSGTRVLKFRSSGVTTDYDSRIVATGGTSTTGQGTLRLHSGFIELQGIGRPQADNTWSFGQASYRFTTLFAATATINTSDEREKQGFGRYRR